MITRQQFLLVPLLALLSAGTIQAQTTWYVDDDNCPGPGTGTVEDPFCTVQDAVWVAIDGDTIEVAPGDYPDRIAIWGRNITIVSTDGPYATKLGPSIGALLHSVVDIQDCDGAGVWIKGFTIRRGTGHETLGYGGGVVIATSKVRLENNIINHNNAWATGGGIYIQQASDTLEIINCLITDNSAPGLDTWNVGGGLYSWGSDVYIRGTTFANNEAGYRGGAVCISGTVNVTIRESVLWGDTAFEGPEIYAWASFGDTIVLTIDYTDIEGGTEGIEGHGDWFINNGEWNIDEDPEFLDMPPYHVPPCSPVVNAGGIHTYINSTDIDGELRNMDLWLDFGADEVDLSLIPFADFDDDGDVDLLDFVRFTDCLTGPCGDPPCMPPLYGSFESGSCCTIGDAEDDGDVDLNDFALFQAAFTGPLP